MAGSAMPRWLLGVLSILTTLIYAHRSLPPGVTCFNQFNSSADALEIPDPKISWASYRILTCDAPVFWLKAQVAAPNQNLSFSALTVELNRFANSRVSVLTIGPGLPQLSSSDQAKVPADVLAAIPAGEGAVLKESPADQSTCSHLTSTAMDTSSTVHNERCHYHEPYADLKMWVLLDETVVSQSAGLHHFAVWNAAKTTSKISFACCDWPEDFTTPMTAPEANCPFCGTKDSFANYLDHFFEHKDMLPHAGFPALQDCAADAGPPTAATAAQCPNETAPAIATKNQPESCQLGCVDEECHSHNIFGQCTYDLAWIMPKPQLTNGNWSKNVTSLILFKGDSIRFYVPKSDAWPHNLMEMQDDTHLNTCNWAGSTQIYTTEEVKVGATYTFSTAGTLYFSCKMTGHCEAGQKLVVEVKDSSQGMKCHDHDHSGAADSGAIVCSGTDVKAYATENPTYGAGTDQCSEMCVAPMALQWMAGAQEGSCADAGYTGLVEAKSVQPAGMPAGMSMQVTVMQKGNVSSPTCHCHSLEDIACDASGDALYDEHIVEIQTYCQDIVDGSTGHCPYKCFQPFEILHLHYLECSLRPKHPLFLKIAAIDKCHEAARPPFGVDCEKVEIEVVKDPAAYDKIWTGPGLDGSSKFATVEIIVSSVIVLILVVIVGGLAAWKNAAIEHAIDGSFQALGRFVGTYPIRILCVTLFLGIVFCGGIAVSEDETDPGKLWVPSGSPALDHNEIVMKGWPSSTKVALLQVLPKDGKVGPNILTAANLKTMLGMHDKLMDITVDGDKIVSDSADIADYNESLGGTWTFQGTGNTKSKCVKWGPVCAMSNILAIFNYNASLIGTDQEMLDRINQWDTAALGTVVPGLGFKGFEVKDVIGEITRDSNNKVAGAKILIWNLFMESKNYEVMVENRGRMRKALTDPIATTWEADAICLLGVQEKHPMTPDKECSMPDGDLSYVGLFSRSLGDEFGAAIQGDLVKMGASYMLIVVYLFVNLGKRDTVHSMLAVSGGALAGIFLSYAGSWGLGAAMGFKQNPLNFNIVFLLLGLGVDDAFVLVSELTRHVKENPTAPVTELIGLTAKSGGSSVLITSITDALAFLVGASTQLPALSAFCVFAGLGVLLCFLFQLFLVLPVLALNLRRAQDNRFDCLCCLKSSVQHSPDDPKGCCCCLCVPACNPNDALLRRTMGHAGKYVVKERYGRLVTLIVWFVVFVVGMAGLTQIKKDFKLEWFFPDGSYVNQFIGNNDKYFSEGTSFSFYTNDLDIFNKQEEMNELASYIRQLDPIKTNSIRNWWADFRPTPINGKGGQTKSEFYQEIWDWMQTSDYTTSIRWIDGNCNLKASDRSAACDPTKGIKGTRIAATLKRLGDGGARYSAYNKMRLDVASIFGEGESSNEVFPFTNDFLYWEENGTIDTELTRNLIVAAGVVFVIILMTIPRPRIALVVGVGILMTMVELVGFMHWWGVTVNGTSTIYILICLGLAVDYSAHIAHVFNISPGSRDERAMTALTQIGPSVFHALISTILAVIALSLSDSYVFRVFFQVLFLATVIAGFKGLWLLPVVLSLIGGDKNEVSCTKTAELGADASDTSTGA